MPAIQELSPDSGRGETRPPEDEIEGDDEDEEVLDCFCSFAWPYEIMKISETVRKKTKAISLFCAFYSQY